MDGNKSCMRIDVGNSSGLFTDRSKIPHWRSWIQCVKLTALANWMLGIRAKLDFSEAVPAER
jgi:hypothetical protein